MFTEDQFDTYKKLFRNERMPLAFVDLDKFDQNISYVAKTQRDTGKTIRVHTKSIRCVELIKRVFAQGGQIYSGIMNFSLEETEYLYSHGFNDFIIAYPTVQSSDLRLFADLTKRGINASLMIDCEEHLKLVSEAGESAGIVLKVCLELDMAYRPLNSKKHLGLRRSPLRTVDQIIRLIHASNQYKWVQIDSLMGYEGHIAGPNDDIPGKWLMNRLIRFLKNRSIKEFAQRRKEVVSAIKSQGLKLRAINGGGSGSLVSTGREYSVTEVTAGSAFFAPGLFWHYKDVSFQPSAFFAIQVVRKPTNDIITCQGGGYPASGPSSWDKQPVPVYPKNMKLLSLEGVGEVQTPLQLPLDCPELSLGDPAFFQHAKSGELCERFNDLFLIKNGEIVEKVKTYRGDGHAFI